jgi:subtilisin family serine protease
MKSSILYLGLAIALVIGGCTKMNFNSFDQQPAGFEKTALSNQRLKGPSYIDGAYIVVFKKDLKDIDTEVEEISRKFKIKSKHRYKNTIKGFSGTLTPEMIEALRSDPRVDYIEQDQLVYVEDIQSNPPSWGLDRIDQRALPLDAGYSYANTASGVDVYIFDTGIRLTHQEFGNRAIMGYDGYAWQGESTDGHGHGTHVAGIVGGNMFGTAKGVRLIAVRVLGNDGVGAWSEVAAGIDWATAHHTSNLAVGNLSLGGGGSVRFVEDAIRQAVADGITMCVAAGNQAIDAEYYTPARTREAITVGASDMSDGYANFSNFGGVVDLIAPGVNILSSYHLSDNSTVELSGTSMATPHVAGAAAVYLASHPSATPADVENALKSNGTPNIISATPGGTNNLFLNLDFSNPPSLVKPFQVSLREPADYNGNVSTSPIISWYASTGATSYSLQISRSADFSTLEYERSGITQCSASGFVLENNTGYYWRVNAENEMGTSEWSTTWGFATNTRIGESPSPTTPYNGVEQVTVPATLAWNSASGARSYMLQIATDAAFTNIVYRNSEVTETSIIVKSLLPGTLYYWRVRGHYVYTISPWSATSSFTTR